MRIVLRLVVLGLLLSSCNIKKTQNHKKTEKSISSIASRDDWKTKKMPQENIVLEIDKVFTEDELAKIKKGFIPEAMEDKWFIFVEEDKVYFHRSWTGTCIYIAHYKVDDQGSATMHKLIVNRDQTAYTETDNDYDVKLFFYLTDAFLLDKEVPFPQKND